MLKPYQERIIQQTAHELTTDELSLGVESNRYERMRAQLLRASGGVTRLKSWDETLPNPEVSLVLLEQLVKLSPPMARLSLKLTVDELDGCWSLPLEAECDETGRARYPTLYDSERKKQGIPAHRYVWRTLIDANIPREIWLDHLCRAHACCNPSHLEPVTPGDNTKRGNHARHVLSGQDQLFHTK